MCIPVLPHNQEHRVSNSYILFVGPHNDRKVVTKFEEYNMHRLLLPLTNLNIAYPLFLAKIHQQLEPKFPKVQAAVLIVETHILVGLV